MARWLTEEWFELVRDLLRRQPVGSGLSARLQLSLSGGAEGDVDCHVVFDDGAVVDLSSGRIADPDVTVAASVDDAARILRGELDPATAYMQGRLKAAGDMATVLALLASMSSEAHRTLRSDVATATEFV